MIKESKTILTESSNSDMKEAGIKEAAPIEEEIKVVKEKKKKK